ncbi:hypothetical protein P5G50_11280 [Leifsonia sp. F6_8S_P_1B]|uniref:Mg chelatase-related protein C-terminal domain-containing protein n=2 Tax=Leifsonia williamsii TaxID=3035919 RepID=A0ABT8KE11_9MICO|nr:hypothetical protein [Leifsonia williamsii]MDN4615031.1 hypothetical protein [Leifsonia williamsii]
MGLAALQASGAGAGVAAAPAGRGVPGEGTDGALSAQDSGAGSAGSAASAGTAALAAAAAATAASAADSGSAAASAVLSARASDAAPAVAWASDSDPASVSATASASAPISVPQPQHPRPQTATPPQGGAITGHPRTSAALRARVTEARAAAAVRLSGTGWIRNADADGTWLRSPDHRPGPSALAPLDRALERGALTMRGYDRTLRLAWTLADLDGATSPTPDHIGRALFLRRGIDA